jgi:hypothetical protein
MAPLMASPRHSRRRSSTALSNGGLPVSALVGRQLLGGPTSATSGRDDRSARRASAAWPDGRPCRRPCSVRCRLARVLAVMAMIGVRRPLAASSSRMAAVAWMPSISGMEQSIRIRSQAPSCQRLTASTPLRAMLLLQPSRRSMPVATGLVGGVVFGDQDAGAALEALFGGRWDSSAGSGCPAGRAWRTRSCCRARGADDADFAAEQMDDLLADGQAEAAAAVAARGRGVGLGEGVENGRLLLLGDADAGVADFEEQLSAVGRCIRRAG